MARLWLGIRYLAVGRIADSKTVLEKARDIDPVSPIVEAWLANSYVASGDFEAARTLIGGAEFETDSALYIYPQYNLLRELGSSNEIETLYQRVSLMPDRDAQYMANLLRAVLSPDEASPIANAEFQMFSAAEQGRSDAFFQSASRYFAEAANARKAIALAYLWAPRLSALRSDPRFSDLAREACLDAYWRVAGPPDLCKLEGDGVRCS
jgi:thioredoxin-like negative regulator of GroEL